MSDTYPDNLEEKYDDLVEKLMAKQDQLDNAVEALELSVKVMEAEQMIPSDSQALKQVKETLSEITGGG